ncbi:MAG: hypothetical protein ACQER9_01070 [Nanobdellota archaeon]
MKQFITLLFTLLLLVGCTTEAIDNSQEKSSKITKINKKKDYEKKDEIELKDEKKKEIKSVKKENLYQKVLYPEDFEIDIYPAGQGMSIGNIISVDSLINSVVYKYNFTDSYVVYYASKWNNKVDDYDMRFEQYIYKFSNTNLSKKAYNNLQLSLFTGTYDEDEENPSYLLGSKESERINIKRRFQKENKEWNYLKLDGKYIIFVESIYPTSSLGNSYEEELKESIIDRFNNPLLLSNNPGNEFKKEMIDKKLYINENEHFKIWLNDIKAEKVDNTSGLLTFLQFTVKGKNNYPFYPSYSYFVRETNTSSNTKQSGIYAKWVLYSGYILDTNAQETITFAEPTSINFNKNGTAEFKIIVADRSRGIQAPYELAELKYNVDLKEHFE